MTTLDWIAATIVVGSMCYLTFALTFPQWVQLVRKGEGVALWPQRADRPVAWWKQGVMILVGVGLGVGLFYYLWQPVVRLSGPRTSGVRIAGLALYSAGFAFMMWARKTLGRNWGISTSLQAKLRDEHELVQTGPYALVRHPMYCGALLLAVGVVLVYPFWAVVILAGSMVLSLTMRARREEAALAARFGAAWDEYRKRTRFLIPYLL